MFCPDLKNTELELKVDLVDLPSVIFWNISWTLFFLLEVHESACKVWLSTEPCWCNQLSINIRLEGFSNILDGILHLTLLLNIISIHIFGWLQIWIINIIFWNFSQLCRHRWGENFAELRKVQISFVLCIN